MATVAGETIYDTILVRDDANVAVDGLVDTDFDILQAYLTSDPGSSATVMLEAVGVGAAEYTISFTPPIAGDWTFHWAYDGTTFFREETRRYEVGTSTQLEVAFEGGTWIYTADPTSARDQIRRLIPDVDPNAPLMSDQEIAMLHGDREDNKGNYYLTAAEACEALADGMPDLTAETTSAKLSFTSEFLMDRARTLRARAARYISAMPYAGGIDKFDHDMNLRDSSRRPQKFELIDEHCPWPYSPRNSWW